MMGCEPEYAKEEEAHLYTSPEEMESLILDDDRSPHSHRHPLSNGGQPTISAAVPTSPSGHPFSPPPEITVTSAELPFPNNRSDFIFSQHSSLLQNPNSDAASSSSLNSSIDPPFCSEAPFRSFDVPASETAGSSRYRGGESDPQYIHITVSDPQKVPEISSNSIVPGSNSYFTYLIVTRTNFLDFNGTEFSVRRRFRDVVTLSDRLAESFRGFVIPLRPDKSVVESQVMQRSEFVEQRRQAIEKYLRKLAGHPVIGRSDELRVFLQVQGKLPLPKSIDVASRMLDGAVNLPKQLMRVVPVAPQEVVQPARGGRDLLRLFKELKQSVTNDWGGSKPPAVEEDKEFLEKKDRLRDLQLQLTNVSRQAEELVKSQQEIGETMGELGLAFVKMTKFESELAAYESQRVRAGDMKNVATATVKVSRFYRELNAQTVKHLDKLHDYLGVMLALDYAFEDRSSALLTVQTLLSELSSLQSKIEKLEVASSKIFGGDRSRMQKIEELKGTLQATEDAKCVAVREYKRIKENNRTELDRVERERQADFVNMVKGFVVNQAGYADKLACVWQKVAEETSNYAVDHKCTLSM